MTIQITIKNDEQETDESKRLFVAKTYKDVHGNQILENVQEIQAGKSKIFCIHNANDLRVYETDCNHS